MGRCRQAYCRNDFNLDWDNCFSSKFIKYKRNVESKLQNVVKQSAANDNKERSEEWNFNKSYHKTSWVSIVHLLQNSITREKYYWSPTNTVGTRWMFISIATTNAAIHDTESWCGVASLAIGFGHFWTTFIINPLPKPKRIVSTASDSLEIHCIENLR